MNHIDKQQNSLASSEPIAIIGMACRLPGAMDTESLWKMLMGGETVWGAAPADRFDRALYWDQGPQRVTRSYTDLAAVMPSLEVQHPSLDKLQKFERRFDIAHQIFLEQACRACEDAGIDPFDIRAGQRTGVYVGHTGGSTRIGDLAYATRMGEVARLLTGTDLAQRLGADRTNSLIQALTAAVRQRYGYREFNELNAYGALDCARVVREVLELDGPAVVFDAACASGLQALAVAVRALRSGRIDQAIVGAVSHFKSDSLVLFSSAQSVSRKGSFPFCADADGLVTAEGQVALLLKPLSSALRDGNRIRAVVEGVGMSSDGKGRSLWAPRSEGQLLAMRRAYPDPATIRTLGYIEAHATGTQVGDATELQALDSLLGEHLESGERIWVGSLKTNIGHTLETAGLASLVKVVLSMEHGLIPPGASAIEPNPVLRGNPHVSVPVTAVPWPDKFEGQGRRSAVNAFGIGGINVHVVLSRGLHTGLALRGHAQHPVKAQIISADCVLPGCSNKSEFIDRMSRGDSALVDAPASRWSVAEDAAKGQHQPHRSLLTKGGYIQDYSFDWRAYRIPPVQIASANPLQYMFIESVDRALKSYEGVVNPQTTAVLVGTRFGGDFSNELQMGLRLPETRRYLNSLLEDQGIGPDEAQDCLNEFEQRVLARYPALLDETGSFTASSLSTRIAKVFNFMGGALSLDAGEHTAACVLSAAQDLLAEKTCDTVICAFGQRHMDLFAYEGISLEWAEQLRRQAVSPGLAIDAITPPGEGVVVLIIKSAADDNPGPVLGDIVIRAASAPQHNPTSQSAAQPKLGHLGAADAAVALLTQVGLGSTGTVQVMQAGLESLIQWSPTTTAIKGKVAAIFPGQGSQYKDCFKNLVDHSPQAAEVLADLDAMCECMDLPSLADTAWKQDHLMGVAVWDTQWAIFLSNLLAWRLLLRLGIRVDYLASHSFGEFPMAVAGGALSFRGGALAARARATALEQHAGASGGLVSVLLDADSAQALIDEAEAQLWISAFNAPRQVVIGGTHEALDALEDRCHVRRIACRRLAVASAFHTPLLDRAVEAFAPLLATLTINPWQIPAFSATTGTQVLDAHALRSNLVMQLTQPVRWVETVQRLYDEGVRTFIEVGPAGVLSGLVRQILKDHSDVEVIQMDQPVRDQSDDPLATLRQKLAARGLMSAFTSAATSVTRGVIGRFDASTERRALNRKRSESAEKLDYRAESDQHGHDESGPTQVDVSEVSPLRQVIIEFVMEHTGYPLDMIDFGVDMEADLGIDSIRKAQLISDLGVRFKVKREAGLSLSDFSCLRDIERFFGQRIQTPASHTVTAGAVLQRPDDAPIFDLICVPMAGGFGLGHLLCLDRDPGLELVAGTGELRHGFLKRQGQTILAWNEVGLILADACLGLQTLPGSRVLRVDAALTLESLLRSAHHFPDLPESDASDARTIHALDSKQGLATVWKAHPNDFPRTALASFAEDEFSGDWPALIRGILNVSGRAQDDASALSAAGRWVAIGWMGDQLRVLAGDGLSPEWAAAADDFADSDLVPEDPGPAVTQRYALRLMDRPPRDVLPAGPGGQSLTLIGHGPVFDSIRTAARHVVARSSVSEIQPESDHRLIIADPAFLSVDEQLPFYDGQDSVSIWIHGIQRWLASVESSKAKANNQQQALLAVMNLGGDLGLSGGALNVKAAAMLGLFKGLAKEYPQVFFRVVDIGDKPLSAMLTNRILSEFSQPEAWTEVAMTESACRVIGLHVAPPARVSEPMPSGETWLVTGGASGITAECAFEFAQRRRIKVALVGKTALDIHAHQSGQEAPSQDAHTRKQEQIRQWLDRYEHAGLEATYISCDLGNSEEVERMIDKVEQALGPIRGVIHGAGVEYSARFAKKSIDSFRTTARPKNLALAFIVHALRHRDRLQSLRALLAFGSTSGHFGGHGQADYSMANQLLARQIARLRDQEPELRATCMHWHAWDGTGMATRGGIPLILAQFGLKLMPLKEGIDHFMSVMEQENPPAELVITEPALVESSGYGVLPEAALPELIAAHASQPFHGRLLLDPRTQPFLHDHRLDNVPLMPAAMAMELLLQVAHRGSPPAKVLCVTEFEIVRSIIHADVGQANIDIHYDPETRTACITQEGEPQASVRATLSSGLAGPAPSTPVNPTDPCPFLLYPTTYHESSALRHGDSLKTLRGTYFDRKGGWGELLSTDPKAVFGRHRIGHVYSPVALLDGCFYACGLYSYFLCGQRVERPVGMKSLSIGTLPAPGRICQLRFFLTGQTDEYSHYDFILSDEQGQMLLEVSGLRMRCYA